MEVASLKGGRMVMLQRQLSLMEERMVMLWRMASLMHAEWSCYGGG